MKKRRRGVGVALLIVALAFGTAPSEASTGVTLFAADGTRLHAEWTAPPAPAPAVLLLHMLTRSHHDWDDLTQSLEVAGFGVLALDLRGHGASGGSRADLEAMIQDVRAALGWLEGQPVVLPGRVGICGASLGSSLAMLAAGDDTAVRSLALLSPAFEYRGLRTRAGWRKFEEREGAALLIAALDDPYAVRCAREAGGSPAGIRDVRILEPQAGHGTALLTHRPDLVWQLVDWFRRTLL